MLDPPRTTRFTAEEQPTKERLQSFFGFIEADFEQPERDLFHPVILKNTDGLIIRSLYPIHCTCITSCECQLAMEQRYEVKNVTALHEFTPSRTIFRAYLQNFLRLKIEAEDYSKKDGTPDEEKIERVRRTYQERFGIKLREHEMRKPYNPCKRQIGKLCVCSIWGKLSQRLDRPKVAYINRYQMNEYVESIGDDDFEILEGPTILSETVAFMKYRGRSRVGRSERQRPDLSRFKLSQATSAFVASQGRCELYRGPQCSGRTSSLPQYRFYNFPS